MSKKAPLQFFLPEKLNPQGWLNDMLLPQLYTHAGGDVGKLRKALYQEKYAGINKKIISFHPAYRELLLETMASKSNDAKKTDPKLDMNYVNFMKNIKPHQIAGMQPYIRIFFKSKQVHAGGASWKDAIEKDIVFRVHTDISALSDTFDGVLLNKLMRGGEAGIESVSVMRDFPVWGLGQSFYFDVSYVFSSFAVFANGHPTVSSKKCSSKWIYDVEGRPVRDARCPSAKDYMILLTPDIQHDFECLNLEYGWKINNKGDKSFWGVNKEILNLVEREERKSFKISWYKHDIEYLETGEVKLKVKYMGQPEKSAFENPSANRETNVLIPLKGDVLKSITNEKEFSDSLETLKKAKKALEKLNQTFQATIAEDARAGKKLSKKELQAEKELQGIDAREEEIKRASVFLNKEKQRLASKASSLYVKRILQNGKLFQARFYSWRNNVPDSAKYESEYHNINVSFHRVLGTGETDSNIKKEMNAKALLEYNKKTAIAAFKNSYGVKSLKDTLPRVKPSKTMLNADDHIYAQLDGILGALTYSNFGTAEVKDVKKFEVKPGEKCPRGYKAKKGKKKGSTKKGKLRCVPIAHQLMGEGRGGRPETYGNFMFFPLRDLIAVMHEFSESDDPKDNPYDRIPITSLGNIVYRPMGKDVMINIGDILIEVGVFQRWFYNKILQQASGTLTFGQFITSIMEALVPAVLSHSTNQLSSGMISSIVHTPLTVSEEYLIDRIADKGFDKLYLDDPDDTSAGGIAAHLKNRLMDRLQGEVKNQKKDDRAIIHFSQRGVPSMSGDKWKTPHTRLVAHRDMTERSVDEKDGLFYLHIGEASGLLETISFSYTDNPKLRTALVYDKYKDVAYPYLKFAYSATPSLVGNNLFYKGGFFVLPEGPLGISVEDDPGITGYYQINKLTDVISPGTYKTTVQGLNVWSGPDQRRAAKRAKVQGKKKPPKPKPIPIGIPISIDEYVHKNFLVNSSLIKAYELKVKDKGEMLDAPTLDRISLGSPPKNIKEGEGMPPNPPSDRVKKMQKKMGMTGDDVDGKFGSDTKKAVKAYQKDTGLKDDGVVGKNTLGAFQGPKKEPPPAAATTGKKDIAELST